MAFKSFVLKILNSYVGCWLLNKNDDPNDFVGDDEVIWMQMTLVRTVMMNKKLHCIVPPIHQLAAGRWGKVKIGFRGVTPVKRVETAISAKRADLTSGPSFIQSQWWWQRFIFCKDQEQWVDGCHFYALSEHNLKLTFGYRGLHWVEEIFSQTHSPPRTMLWLVMIYIGWHLSRPDSVH